MAPFVSLAQVGDVEFGVVVQRLKGLVPQELFDVVEVGIALDHLGCTGAPERVRRDGDRQIKIIGILMDSSTHAALGQRLACCVDEDGVGLRTLQHVRSHTPDVGGQPFQGGLADGDEAFPPAFADDTGDTVFKVKVGQGQAFQFADPDTGRVKQLDGRPVHDTGWRAGVDLAHELPDLGMSQNAVRQKMRFPDIPEMPGQVTGDEA